ncbi:hypothetical protein ASZ90_019968 [hydrocarbon metagenome]|uniref:Uncharacterized protein n=1 Tax=hydrocarbon metagenome TaxID=938273 RepID=A0A0W8E1S1_9ZZZZ
MSLKEDWLQKAKEIQEKNDKIMARIPEEYRHYVQHLSRASKVAKKVVQLDKELEGAGYFTTENGTYLNITNAYLTVAGKNAMLTDWVEEKDYRFSIENEIITLKEKFFIKSVIKITNEKGEEIRRATSTVPVNIGGSGVDRTNPFENGETSAVGRALTFLGMGRQLGEIASYEEVVEADRLGEEQQQVAKEGFIIDSFEFKDETRNAGKIRLVDSNGELQVIAGWGRVFKEFISKVDVGSRVKIKTEPFTTQTQEQAQKLVEYECVA